MKNNVSFAQSLAPVTKFFSRFHYLIFFIIIGGLVATGLLTIITTISSANSEIPAGTNEATSFDQPTIDQLKNLTTEDQSTSIDFPNGRINPFVE